MALNLRNKSVKNPQPTSPILPVGNPVEDFLAPFKKSNDELQQKISMLSSGNNPATLPQQINFDPVFDPLKNSWDMLSWGGTTVNTPIKAPTDQRFVDPTQGSFYQAIAPYENTIGNIGQSVKEGSQNLQDVGAKIMETWSEVGNWIQNKAPWYDQAKAEGRFLSMDQVKSFLDENPDMTEEQLVSAMADLEKEWFMFEWYNDLNNEEAGTSMTRDLLGAWVKWVSSMFWMGAEALWGTMKWVGNIAEWNTWLGVSEIAAQVPNIAMTWINAAFPWASALASTAFSTDPGQAVMEPVMGVSQDIVKAWLDMTNLDPNSEEYQNYLKWGTWTLPLVAWAWIAKWMKGYAPEIKTWIGKAWEFISENAPKVWDAIGKAWEVAWNMAGKVSEKAQRISQVATDFIDKEIIGIDKGKKAWYQASPFVKEYFDRMIEQSKSPEGITDVKTLATDFVSEVVDKLQPIIKMKEKALSEDSPIYRQIREMPTLVDANPIIQSFSEILKKNGLALDESGQVYRAPGTAWKTLNQADVWKINQLYQDIIADANANGGKLTTAQTLDARKSASKLAKYDASTTTDGQSVVRSMRSAIDKTAKDSIEWLRDIDKNFVDKLEAFEDATRDLVYKQWENKGEFISNFNSKIKNLMNDRNSPLRARLDEIMPDISARIEAINQIPELYKAFNRKLLRSRFADGAVWGASAWFLLGISSWPLWAIAWLVLGGIVWLVVEGWLTKFKEARLRSIVSNVSASWKARLDAINKKFAKNEALSKADERFLKELQRKIAIALVKEKIFPKEVMKLLSGPSGLDLSARVVDVNPITAGPSMARQRILGKTRTKAMKAVSPDISRPSGTLKTKPAEMYGKEAIALKEKTAAYDEMVKNLKSKIASDTWAARFGWTGNQRVESAIKWALDTWKIDQATAFDIITEIIDDVKKSDADKTYRTKYSYIDTPKLEKFLNDIYEAKQTPEVVIPEYTKENAPDPAQKTPFQMYDEINRAAHDRRFSNDTIDAKIEEFKKVTGKDPIEVSYQDFSAEGMLKTWEKYRTAEDLNNTQLTTKILKWLGDRETVSKEFIRNMTNSGDVKQVEKDIIRGLLESEGDKVNVADFKKKVQAELLPLKAVKQGTLSRYEEVSLPKDIRWKIMWYAENIYESPIETSAGNVHFNGQTKNYFWHTRIEDMADGSTRRVIEVQSDLFQKGNLEKEITSKTAESSSNKLWGYEDIRTIEKMIEDDKKMIDYGEKNWINTDSFKEQLKSHQEELDWMNKKLKNSWVAKLSQYNDPTAHFRMIREEVSKAVEDGKTKLQFPTWETAMKIEGLGSRNEWWDYELSSRLVDENPNIRMSELQRQARLTPENLKVWKEVNNWGNFWIITDVLWDGKFKAVEKRFIDLKDKENSGFDGYKETFDISWKADQNNPIYKFYEKEVGRYLKNKYDAKLVTDDKWVSWYQVDLKESMGGPVEAFRKGGILPRGKNTNAQRSEIKSLNKKFFWDDSLQIVDKIASNEKALGSYKDGMIKIVDGQGNLSDTFHHEAVHKYLDVFATKEEARVILEDARAKYKESDYVNAEEKIAEDFIKFAKERLGVTGKVRTIFESIINRIKTYFGKWDSISQMYRDIIAWKAKWKPILPRGRVEKYIIENSKEKK